MVSLHTRVTTCNIQDATQHQWPNTLSRQLKLTPVSCKILRTTFV